MPFECTGLSVLFTGPGDTRDLVEVGIDEVHRWNAQRARNSGYILLPQHYSQNAVSLFYVGGDGQAVINDQLVKDADIVISVFRNRLGTETPRAVSGTAEEIKQSMDDGTRVHVYFDDGQKLDPRAPESFEQWQKLQTFREGLKAGLWDTVTGEANFRDLVRRALEADVNVLGRRSRFAAPLPPPSALPTASPSSDPTPEMDLDLSVGPDVGYFVDADMVLETYISKTTADAMDAFQAARASARIPTTPAGKRMSAAEMNAKLEIWAEQVRRSWPSGLRYLAGWSSPQLALSITQRGDSHLKAFRIDLTFRGAIGADYRVGREFELSTMIPEAPSVRGQGSFYVGPEPDLSGYIGTDFRLSHREDPMSWENTDAGDLIVTVELERLRPRTPWKDAATDIVVLIPEVTTADTVLVEWAASADGINGVIEGVLPLPVRQDLTARSIKEARAKG